MASIFRTIHTIKGSCGFLGFARLEKVAHAGESLLSLLRDGKLALTVKVTSGLLAMVDAVRCMLTEIQATEHDGENDYPELRERLKQLQGGGRRNPPHPAAASVSKPVAVVPSAAEAAVPASAATTSESWMQNRTQLFPGEKNRRTRQMALGVPRLREKS